MPTVTLTTDYGLRDPYVAQLKGAILTAAPSALLVDCTHLISPYDLIEAAYHLGHTWSYFPAGTIHVCPVNRVTAGEPEPLMCFRKNDHAFIFPNNGLVSLLFDDFAEEAYAIGGDEPGSTKTAIARAIGELALGLGPRQLGAPIAEVEHSIRPAPVTHPSYIRGSIVHIDGYGNAVLNIHRDLVERMANGRRIHTRLPNTAPIEDIVDHYHEAPEGELLVRYNARGYLEIAMKNGKVATLYGLERDQLVQLEFA